MNKRMIFLIGGLGFLSVFAAQDGRTVSLASGKQRRFGLRVDTQCEKSEHVQRIQARDVAIEGTNVHTILYEHQQSLENLENRVAYLESERVPLIILAASIGSASALIACCFVFNLQKQK